MMMLVLGSMKMTDSLKYRSMVLMREMAKILLFSNLQGKKPTKNTQKKLKILELSKNEDF